MTATNQTIRDAITGAEILAVHTGHHIVISDDNIEVIHLSPAGALQLARQILDALTPAQVIDVIG